MLNENFKPYLTEHSADADSHTLAHYEKRGGYDAIKKVLKEYPRDGIDKGQTQNDLIQLVKDANLLGRGGAGFPAGVKWGFIPREYDGPKYLVCNGDESEPGTFKDIVLMKHEPHMVIEGMLMCGWACGLTTSFIYLRGEFYEGARVFQAAIEEARDKGYLGKDACGIKGWNFDVTLVRGAGAYICGEETGMLSSIEGGRAYPKNKPPFPANPGGGLFGAPTIVNNVETLANIPFLVNRGLDWFKEIGLGIGKPDERPPKNENHGYGSKLVSISGHVEKPGTFEMELGMNTWEMIEKFSGGMWKGRKLKACIPGGSSAKILTADETRNNPYSFYGMANAGSMLGSGAVIVLDETVCMVDALYNLVRFYHHESCGQCTPCREGCGWMEKILKRIYHGNGKPGDIELLNDIATNGAGRTICALYDAAAFPVWSYTIKFRQEFDYFIEHGHSMVTGKPAEAIVSGA